MTNTLCTKARPYSPSECYFAGERCLFRARALAVLFFASLASLATDVMFSWGSKKAQDEPHPMEEKKPSEGMQEPLVSEKPTEATPLVPPAKPQQPTGEHHMRAE